MNLQKKGPEALSHSQVFHPSSGLWVFSDPGINLYLIAGETRAVLLDSGFGGAPGLREQAEALCGRSVDLFHTHAHGDHTGGDRAWTETWLHPGDWARYRQDHGDWGLTVHPLENGMVLDLGGRSLEVLHIPGDPAGRREFSLDLMVAVERFAGYGCRGYAVTTQALSSTF